jgi:acetyl esterase/lipase
VERVSSRPDFFALIYPGGLTRPDLTVGADVTPPAFLVCAYDDRMPEALANFFSTLKRAGVNAELHIYNRGGHGFGMRRRPLAVTGWPTRFLEWMNDRGWLASEAPSGSP